MKKIVSIILLLSVTLNAGTINVALAANVSYAIDKLIEKFNEANPDIKVQVTLGSSGKLTAQIKHGAPYDVFLAANMKYPEALFEDKIAVTTPIVYAQGSLAMLSTQKIDLTQGISAITDKKVKKIALASPKTAPYGKAALEAIKNAKLLDIVEKKFVYAESISQTVTYVITATDVGFIAKSSLYSSQMSAYQEGVNWVNIDAKLYTPIDQGIVILKQAKQNKEAKAFYDFMLSSDARDIFKEFGYILP